MMTIHNVNRYSFASPPPIVPIRIRQPLDVILH